MKSMNQIDFHQRTMQILLAIVASFMLMACGGGNKPTASTTTPATAASVLPTLALVMKNAAGAVASSITPSDAFTLYATVRDASGVAQAGQVVTFAGDSTLFKLSPAGWRRRERSSGSGSWTTSSSEKPQPLSRAVSAEPSDSAA